jgi:hypothetical protein
LSFRLPGLPANSLLAVGLGRRPDRPFTPGIGETPEFHFSRSCE